MTLKYQKLYGDLSNEITSIILTPYAVLLGLFVAFVVSLLDKKMKYTNNEYILNEWVINYESFQKAGRKTEYS